MAGGWRRPGRGEWGAWPAVFSKLVAKKISLLELAEAVQEMDHLGEW